jgi:hypothetical protein
LIGKQKVVLFPTFRKNEGEGKGREAARNALSAPVWGYLFAKIICDFKGNHKSWGVWRLRFKITFFKITEKTTISHNSYGGA